jgi:CBS domain containing-hemolysin-like protein
MTLIGIAIACLVVTMFFSAAEMAFIAANRLKLRHMADEGHVGARRYLEAFRQPERFLSTAMMGVTLAHIIASSAATSGLLPVLGNLAPVVVTAVLTPVVLVVGEVIPKAVARESATGLILALERPLAWMTVLLGPLVWMANAIVTAILRTLGHRGPDTRKFVSREELKLLLQMEPGEADVTTQEAEMIDKIFDLGDTTVREIMVPLVEVVAIPDTTSPAEAVAVIQDRGFSRLPIFRDRVTNIIGIVTAMDLFHRGAEARTVEDLVRQPYYVPETKRIDDLLREMQRARMHMAIVVDEYGGSTGVVTLEDVVEQIVGEIQDEHDRTPAVVERLPDGSYRVLGRTEVAELNEALEWDLPKEDYETVAGLVLSSLHRIPRTGEEFQVRGYSITVLDADARRVIAVKIARTAKSSEGG